MFKVSTFVTYMIQEFTTRYQKEVLYTQLYIFRNTILNICRECTELHKYNYKSVATQDDSVYALSNGWLVELPIILDGSPQSLETSHSKSRLISNHC